MRKARLFFLLTGWMIQDALSYRGMMFIWMFHIFFFPLIILLVWYASAANNPTLSEKLPTLTNYYIIFPFFSLITSAWHGTFFADRIRKGDLNKHLVKPISPFLYDVTDNLGEKLVKALFLIPLVIVGILFFPVRVSLDVPTIGYLILALFLGLVLNFLMQAVIGIMGFWIDEVTSLLNWNDALESTIGGKLMPIFLFPVGIAVVARLLPFYYFTGFPLEILSHSLSGREILQGFVIELIWVGLLFIGLVFGWKKGVAKYSAYGG
jgi:ABC-2 type transport system permease protein